MESVVSVRVVGPEVERAKLAATLLAYESLVARRVAGEGEKACTVGGDAWEDVGSRATLVLGETKYRGPVRAELRLSAAEVDEMRGLLAPSKPARKGWF